MATVDKKAKQAQVIKMLTGKYRGLSRRVESRRTAFGIVINTSDANGVTLSDKFGDDAEEITSQVLNSVGYGRVDVVVESW